MDIKNKSNKQLINIIIKNKNEKYPSIQLNYPKLLTIDNKLLKDSININNRSKINLKILIFVII